MRAGRRADLTAVRVQAVDRRQWMVGGQLLADTASAACCLRIEVTEGADGDDDAARYIAAVHHALEAELGERTSYVVVQGHPAARWGWGGRTQAARREARQPALSPA